MDMFDQANDGQLFDVVIPQGNETEFIDMALSLGYKEIVFLTADPKYSRPSSDKINIKAAFFVDDVSKIERFKSKFDYIFAPAERKFFEQNVDYILDSELSSNKDSFHYRATSLNQVHAELAKKNNINLIFSFSNLLASPVLVLSKMYQNSLLVNKYHLRRSSFSMARKPSQMRSRAILNALLSVLSL